MIALNLAGITFLDERVKKECLSNRIHINQECVVRLVGREESKYDADFSVRVKLEDGKATTEHHIGWIPQTNTVMKYMNQAYKNKDNEAYKRQCERFRLLEILRGNIYTDITTNKLDPYGIINNILFIEGQKFFNEGAENKDRKLASISCQFEYPNP